MTTISPPTSARKHELLLEELLEATPVSYLEPYAFFPAWQGVLTLAFSGFTPALLELKQRITEAHPELPAEASGSKWPKTSIGCLHDDKTLTPEQFNVLMDLCKQVSAKLFSPNACPKITVDSASVVLYSCRCLESVVSCQPVLFGSTIDTSGPPGIEVDRVKGIVAEADAEGYYAKVAKQGNRKQHYTGPALGVTLMHPLPINYLRAEGHARAQSPRHAARAGLRQRGIGELYDRQRLLQCIDEFKREVDAALPGMYYWFDDSTLHVTLRALIL